ncbi:hypothetical protein LIER_21411 [Lithospermum erythrorhizon]|uniref:Uncharacterized protein n=1 Tax=Lithospermum erythrorhizon TaxID=34254 RepID=A0AAV3QSL4_LITER
MIFCVKTRVNLRLNAFRYLEETCYKARLKMRVHFGHIIRKKQGKDIVAACMRSMKMKWKEWYGSPESSIISPLFC